MIFYRTCKDFSKVCILQFFMMLGSDISGIFMFVLVFFTVAMQLNYESLRNELRIITNLSSNERGANL